MRLEQDVDAPLLLLGIDIIRLARCRGTGPGRKALDMNDVELDFFEQVEGEHELLFGLTRVAHDHIGRDRQILDRRPRVADDGAILVARVTPAHLLEDDVIGRLEGQVQMLADPWEIPDGE